MEELVERFEIVDEFREDGVVVEADKDVQESEGYVLGRFLHEHLQEVFRREVFRRNSEMVANVLQEKKEEGPLLPGENVDGPVDELSREVLPPRQYLRHGSWIFVEERVAELCDLLPLLHVLARVQVLFGEEVGEMRERASFQEAPSVSERVGSEQERNELEGRMAELLFGRREEAEHQLQSPTRHEQTLRLDLGGSEEELHDVDQFADDGHLAERHLLQKKGDHCVEVLLLAI